MANSHSPAGELRSAYDNLVQLNLLSHVVDPKVLDESRAIYLRAFQAYNRGDLHNAELLARASKHLCRAACLDAKIKHLEWHADDLPHVPGLTAERGAGCEERMLEVQNRLARLKLTGLADRFALHARDRLRGLENLPNTNSLLAEAFQRAAYEYCLATEALHQLELMAEAA